MLFHHSASGADLPDESERPGVWMWLSALSMTKLGKKSPLGKEASMQMEKGHNGLRGNSCLQNSVSESKCGDPRIREIKRES